jgi:hypothetical protein
MRRALLAATVVIMLSSCGGGGSVWTQAPAAESTAASITTGATTSSAPATSVTAASTTEVSSTTTTAPPPPATCSAAGMAAPPLSSDLPAAVRDKVAAIVSAAVACDYQSLAALADPEQFVFTIDPNADADPASYWAQQEQFGATPLGSLVDILWFSSLLADTSLGPTYVWPAVAAYDNWFDAPESARLEMEGYYPQGDIEAFQEEGYLGIQVGITADGRWLWACDLVGGG